MWQPTLQERLPRRERSGCHYDAYVPDDLVGRVFRLDGDVAADVTDAETSVQKFDLSAAALTGLEGLARLLLRAEAVASSRIEGLEVGGRRLLHAEAAKDIGHELHDVTAEEVLGNIDAMRWAIETLTHVRQVKRQHILEIHRRLLKGTKLDSQAGKLRQVQNWIGGSDYNPCHADFVPAPSDLVPQLVDDLCDFCNTSDLPAIAQAAMVHAQFETIHPFIDGNGRTGRALIHVVLRRRGLTTRITPPISLVLATMTRDYVRGLTGTRYIGPPDSTGAHEGVNSWVATFAAAAKRAVADAQAYEAKITTVQRQWRKRIGKVRQRSSVDLLIETLPGAPIVTVTSAAKLIKRSFPSANDAIDQLLKAGVVRQVRLGKRNRAFEATAVIDAFNELELRLASPTGDTNVAPPNRRVPQRTKNS